MKTLTVIGGWETGTLVLITCENESIERSYLNRCVIFAKSDR